MQTINYNGKDIPVTATADVVVTGGGPGGVCAAVSAARHGADTVLVERYGAPGGMASFGEVSPMMPNHACGRSLNAGIYMEICRRMWTYLPPAQRSAPYDPELVDYHPRLIDKNAAMLTMEDLCLESGVKLLFHHTLVDVIKAEDDTIRAGVFVSKSGLSAITGKVFIDSTGDGDLAAMAGCETRFGNCEGLCQPMTLCFKLQDIDREKFPDRTTLNKLYDQAKADGTVECPRENILYFETFDRDCLHFNTTRIIRKSGISGTDLSQAEIEGRRQLRQLLNFFRERVPGCREAKIASIAHHIGIRESRRIVGEIFQTQEDFFACRKYDDAIAKVHYFIDIHNPAGSGTTCHHLPDNEYYELSYRAILPKHTTNLLMGCRAISVDHELHSSMRIMPPVCAIGEAAGCAAAMAVKENISLRQIDGTKLNAALYAAGAFPDLEK